MFYFPSPSFDEISFAARLLIRSLLSTEPEGRYSAKQVTEHFWIKNPGYTDDVEEEDCMNKLADSMALFGQPHNGEFEETDTEYFYSRRASMDDLSDCGASHNEHELNEEASLEPVPRRPESSRELSRSSFVFNSSTPTKH